MKSSLPSKKIFLALAVALIGLFIYGGLASMAGATETSDQEKFTVDLVNDRAMGYYLSGLTAADSDEENGNSYNWRKKGAVTINGQLQKFEDGTTSEDRCVSSKESDGLAQDLVEHWYTYDALEGAVVKRSQLPCSSIQYGTECKAGACVPVPVPPDDFIVTQTAQCKWMFGDCACPENYTANYEKSKAFCESQTHMTWRYNVLSGSWEKIKNPYYHNVEYGPHPEWIYANSDKDSFKRAVAAFNAGPEAFTLKKPDRPDPGNQCVRNLVDTYKSLFDSCFRQVGSGKRFDAYNDCVAKNGGDAYRKDVLTCGQDLLNWHPDNTTPTPNSSTLKPTQPKPPLDPLAQKFVEALIENRPKLEDFPPDVPGLREGSDVSRLIGNLVPDIEPGKTIMQYKLPNGTVAYQFTFAGHKAEKQDYVMKLREIVGNPKFILPDGTLLQGAYANPGMQVLIPAGTKIITPPDSRVTFQIQGARYEGSSAIVQMENSSEVSLDPIDQKFARLQATKGFIRFQENPLRQLTPIPPVSEWDPTPEGTAAETLKGMGAPQWIISILESLDRVNRTSHSTADVLPRGTDFGVTFDTRKNKAIAEVYDGTIKVIARTTNASTTVSSVYGSDIKRVEVGENGKITEKTAIPKSEWQTPQKQIEPPQHSSRKRWVIVLLLIVLTAIYVGYQKGILKKLIERIPHG